MVWVKKDINMEQLGAFCRFKPTLADCAAFFKCSDDTIMRRIKEETGLSFSEFREQHFVHSRFDMVREAMKRSKKSDTILIFCLKNMCKWRDKQPDEDAVDLAANTFLKAYDPNKKIGEKNEEKD